MRLLLLLAFLFASGLPVAAQAPPLLAQHALAPAPAADTVAAIHRLFAARRKTCTYVVGGTFALMVGTGVVTGLDQPAPQTSGGFSFGGPVWDDQSIMLLGIGVVGAAVVGLELLTIGGWGQREEARMVAAFDEHRLPRHIKRRLKPSYFR